MFQIITIKQNRVTHRLRHITLYHENSATKSRNTMSKTWKWEGMEQSIFHFTYFNTVYPFHEEGSVLLPRNLLPRIHLLLGNTPSDFPASFLYCSLGFPGRLHDQLLGISFHFVALFGPWFLKPYIFLIPTSHFCYCCYLVASSSNSLRKNL